MCVIIPYYCLPPCSGVVEDVCVRGVKMKLALWFFPLRYTSGVTTKNFSHLAYVECPPLEAPIIKRLHQSERHEKQVGLSRATLDSQVKLDHFDVYRLDRLDLSLLDLS